MKEIRDIIQAYKQARAEGRQTALATVVHVEGSSYRRPGARMLVTDEGQLTGAISGGCLEGDALRKALLVMKEKRSMLVTYDTMDEDDAKFGVGLGCNGIIQVLIEPIDASLENNPISYLEAIAAERKKAVLVTLFSMDDRKTTQPGTCMLLKEDGHMVNRSPLLQDTLEKDARDTFRTQQSSFKKYINPSINLTAFIELIRPAVSLVIAGAGNDAIPLVEMAAILGWDITVVDGRASYAKKNRFPQASTVITAKPGLVLDHLTIDDQTVFVLVTHNYNYDKALLKLLVSKGVQYAGMLGPRKKLERMLTEWEDEGLRFTSEQLSVIHSPVGLNIGAETAEEIALSILAEIKAVLSGKQGQFLKTDDNTIHARQATLIEEKRID